MSSTMGAYFQAQRTVIAFHIEKFLDMNNTLINMLRDNYDKASMQEVSAAFESIN